MKPFSAQIKSLLQYLVLPLAAAAYPVLFLFEHNAKILTLADLALPLGLPVLVAIIGYGLFYLFQRRQAAASLSMALFMVVYYLYGTVYSRLVQRDQFPVYHFILLPIMATLGIYAGYLISLVNRKVVEVTQKAFTFIAAALVMFNLVAIIPAEAHKSTPKPITTTTATKVTVNTQKKYPDIYYIILDEYAGFNAMRGYWHADATVDQFSDFLAQNHFFVSEKSLSYTINTLSETASRLNLHQFKENTDSSLMLEALRDNKVEQVLKSYGYTTVVMDMAFQGIKGDKNISFAPQKVEGMGSSEFKQNFINNTMADAFSNWLINNDKEAVQQRDFILSALNQTTNLADIQSPKFVYTHLLLPHEPFIFDASGNLLPTQDHYDWHYYLGQYQYTTKLAEQLLTKLLAQADPNNPPVIILQSDHGARNLQSKILGNIVINGVLENYSTKYFNMILNAMYLPGYDTSKLLQDMAPIDTFKVVLNHYLDAGVSVDINCPCDH